MLNRIQKRVKLKGKVTTIVREQYLRDDVKCHSPLCQRCLSQQDTSVTDMSLDKYATHYAIPAFDVVQKYLEVFEIPEIKGIIFLQSIAMKVLHAAGRRNFKRFQNICRDSRRGCALFLNEVCKQTSIERLPTQSNEEWLVECTSKAVEYYNDHLNSSLPIILITEKREMYKEMEEKNNIWILSLRRYLEMTWSNLKYASELYDSISVASSLSNIKDPSKLYTRYLPTEVLQSGIKTGRYFRGILKVNKHMSSQEAFIVSSRAFTKDVGDVLIFGMKDRNRALHGDDVVVELLPRNEWKSRCQYLVTNVESVKADDTDGLDDPKTNPSVPTGRVVGIMEKRWRDYVATLPEENEESSSGPKMSGERILVIPYDYRIPKIRIATKQADKLRNQRIIVRIDNWDKDSQFPNGHFVKSLGELGLLETEVLSLLVEHNISNAEFPQCLLPELPTSTKEKPWNVEETEVSKRKDLRKSHLIFSIDPKGCEDVDDTLSIRELSNGELELGVHIADVTYFLRPSSLTDLEAQSRSTSVYLPDRRYNMLPHVLSGDLCSLLGNVDRYAVSVIWNLDSNFEVKNVWFGRTVICSNYKLCYEDAQDILLGRSVKEMQINIQELQHLKGEQLHQRFDELKDAISKLVYVSNGLRNKRSAHGGLELNSINMKFEIDESLPSVVSEFKQTEELDVHKTVAECMIFANQWVAKKISESFPQQAVLRRHPCPREPDLVELQKLAAAKGFSLKIHSNKELAESLDQAVDPQDPTVNQLFRILVTRAMNVASYFCTGTMSPEDFHHYGLGLDQYTHFTSPIRRYADVLVHRLLLASIGDQNENTLLKMTELEALCNHMNEKHKAAQDVEKVADELYQSFFFSELAATNNSAGCLVDGVIYCLKSNGMIVFIPQYGIKGAVCLRNKDGKVAIVKDNVQWVDGRLEVHEVELTVKTTDCIQQYNIFDHITICIKVQKSRSHHTRVTLELVKNEPYFPIPSATSNNVVIKSTSKGSKGEFSKKTTVQEERNNQGMEDNKLSTKIDSLYFLLRKLKEMTLMPPEILT